MFDTLADLTPDEQKPSGVYFEVKAARRADGSAPNVHNVCFEVHVDLSHKVSAPEMTRDWSATVVIEGNKVCNGTHGLQFSCDRTQRLFEREAGYAVMYAKGNPGLFL